jgi:predicted metal-dependent HD superfamily phosphohydrolase
MNEDHDYISLMQQLVKHAAESADPGLASAYWALEIHYHALGFWHQRFVQHFQAVVATRDKTGNLAVDPPTGQMTLNN